jgi:hypothetical protein
MKSFFLSLLLCLFFSKANSQTDAINDDANRKGVTASEIEKIAIGDINNDKVVDTVYIKMPKFSDNEQWGDCRNGGCEVTISFSCGLPNIELDNAVSAGIENIGDIDKDGISEIIIVPGWIVGCWGQFRFLSLKNKQWKEIGRAKRNTCAEESYSTCIKNIKGKKITVIEEIWVDGDVVEKTKIISVK